MRDKRDGSYATSALVALVEDHPCVLEALSDLLMSAGHTPHPFSSAQAFLKSGLLSSIDCLVCDIRLPGLDGWQLLGLARLARPHLPVVLITAYDTPAKPALLSIPGAAPLLLHKPLDAQRLLSGIERSLGPGPA